MKASRLLILTVSLIFVLACSVSMGAEPTPVPPPPVNPPQAVLPTYTPYPTYTVVAPSPPPAILPSATVPPTSSAPRLTQEFLTPGKGVDGTTYSAAKMYTFDGQAGQTVEIILVGVNNYQTFSIRDEKNEGLIGCNIDTQTTCAIRNFKLPYTGIYYVLVDRTDSPEYAKYCENKWHGSSQAPVWCYIGGPYSITLNFQ
jgi:hypothetical protein